MRGGWRWATIRRRTTASVMASSKKILAAAAVAAIFLLFSAAQPLLNIARQGTNVVISWSGTNSSNFTLQRSPILPASNGWMEISQSNTSNAGVFSVILSPTNPASFFRLFLSASNIVDDPDDTYTDSNGDGIDG